MKHVLIVVSLAAVGMMVLSSGIARAAEDAPKPAKLVISWTTEMHVGISAAEVGRQLAENPELLAKVNAKLLEAKKADDEWAAETRPKHSELWKQARAAKKDGDDAGYKKLRKEADALKIAYMEMMGKFNAEVLAMLPSDEARLQVRADMVFLTGKRTFEKLELTQKQWDAIRVLCTEGVKPNPKMRSYVRQDMFPICDAVTKDALTKVLSPEQATTLYERLAKKNPKKWPADQAPKPVE